MGTHARDDDRRRGHLHPGHPAAPRRGVPGRRPGHPHPGRPDPLPGDAQHVLHPVRVPDGVRPGRPAVPRRHAVHHRRLPDGLGLQRLPDVVRPRWCIDLGGHLPAGPRLPVGQHRRPARRAPGQVPAVRPRCDPRRAGRPGRLPEDEAGPVRRRVRAGDRHARAVRRVGLEPPVHAAAAAVRRKRTPVLPGHRHRRRGRRRRPRRVARRAVARCRRGQRHGSGRGAGHASRACSGHCAGTA